MGRRRKVESAGMPPIARFRQLPTSELKFGVQVGCRNVLRFTGLLTHLIDQLRQLRSDSLKAFQTRRFPTGSHPLS
jgi:hypothetical protein